jgi:hypothetical protein
MNRIASGLPIGIVHIQAIFMVEAGGIEHSVDIVIELVYRSYAVIWR